MAPTGWSTSSERWSTCPESPADYFRAFKRVIRSATKEGYFRIHPAEDVQSKTNPSKKARHFLEADEYVRLIKEPLENREIRDAFIFCCYTGLRWCDVKNLRWKQIEGNSLVTTIIQKKTGKPVQLNLHHIAQTILDNRRKKILAPGEPQAPLGANPSRFIFSLPTCRFCSMLTHRSVLC
jgi:integrase